MLPKPNDGFEWVQAAGGAALVCRALQPLADHLFTTRPWRLGSTVAGRRDEDWDEVARVLSVDPRQLVRVHQLHGAAVVVRRRGEGATPGRLPDGDVIVTDDPSLALAIQTADCVPLLMADRRIGAVAAAHAGWRGLAARVPMVAVEALTRAFGSRSADLVAAVGPSISAPRYEVGADVRARFAAAGFSPSDIARWFADADRPQRWYFDGWQAARDELEAAGVPGPQIHVAALCTASHPDVFCSNRRDGSPTGRLAAALRARGAEWNQPLKR
jgi:polyphenol oxidase